MEDNWEEDDINNINPNKQQRLISSFFGTNKNPNKLIQPELVHSKLSGRGGTAVKFLGVTSVRNSKNSIIVVTFTIIFRSAVSVKMQLLVMRIQLTMVE